jgi:hypothetical protein
MKQLARIFVAASIFTASLAIAPVSFVSCQQPPTLSQENTDQIILRAEQTAQVSRDTFNLFVHLERDNEALLKQVNPSIHDYANTIRKHGLDWVESLRQATKTFKANRTADNQASLNTWLTTLNNAVSQTNKYIAQSKQAVGNP